MKKRLYSLILSYAGLLPFLSSAHSATLVIPRDLDKYFTFQHIRSIPTGYNSRIATFETLHNKPFTLTILETRGPLLPPPEKNGDCKAQTVEYLDKVVYTVCQLLNPAGKTEAFIYRDIVPASNPQGNMPQEVKYRVIITESYPSSPDRVPSLLAAKNDLTNILKGITPSTGGKRTTEYALEF